MAIKIKQKRLNHLEDRVEADFDIEVKEESDTGASDILYDHIFDLAEKIGQPFDKANFDGGNRKATFVAAIYDPEKAKATHGELTPEELKYLEDYPLEKAVRSAIAKQEAFERSNYKLAVSIEVKRELLRKSVYSASFEAKGNKDLSMSAYEASFGRNAIKLK